MKIKTNDLSFIISPCVHARICGLFHNNWGHYGRSQLGNVLWAQYPHNYLIFFSDILLLPWVQLYTKYTWRYWVFYRSNCHNVTTSVGIN